MTKSEQVSLYIPFGILISGFSFPPPACSDAMVRPRARVVASFMILVVSGYYLRKKTSLVSAQIPLDKVSGCVTY